MKVAFINSLYPPFATGGAEATLQGLAEGLVRRGWEAHVICLTPEATKHEDILQGVNVSYLPSPNVMWPFDQHQPTWRKALFQLIEAYNPIAKRRLRERLQRIRPDVVHMHNLRGFSVSAWRAAADLRLPVVQTLHDYNLVCPRSVMFKNGRNCARQCVSCRLFTTPRRFSSAIPRSYTAVSHRMVERMAACDAFPVSNEPIIIRGDNPEFETSAFSAPKATNFTFGFLGRLDPMKGLEVLIAAASHESLRDCPVLIAGTGDADYEAGLKSAARSASNVTFSGRMDRNDFFNKIDILVVPSVWEEPLGRVVHEALGYGCPVIASNTGGISEIIEDEVTGFLVPAANAEALANTMLKAKSDQPRLRAMATACRAAGESFARPLILSQYEQVLRAACRIADPEGRPHAQLAAIDQ